MRVYFSQFGEVYPLEAVGETEKGFRVNGHVTEVVYREDPQGKYKTFLISKDAVADAIAYIERHERFAYDCLERMAKRRLKLTGLGVEKLLHVLRNPYGFSAEEVRQARLDGADLIDTQQRAVVQQNYDGPGEIVCDDCGFGMQENIAEDSLVEKWDAIKRQEVKTALVKYELVTYAAIAGVFAADRPQLLPAKVWKWDDSPVDRYPRNEDVKAQQRKNRRKKRVRKNRRGY